MDTPLDLIKTLIGFDTTSRGSNLDLIDYAQGLLEQSGARCRRVYDGSGAKANLFASFGPAGDGYEYHHIVEQGPESGIPDSDIQSTGNIVRIPKLLHEEISSEYGQLTSDKTQIVRNSLRGKSFEEQFQNGLKVMRQVGILQ